MNTFSYGFFGKSLLFQTFRSFGKFFEYSAFFSIAICKYQTLRFYWLVRTREKIKNKHQNMELFVFQILYTHVNPSFRQCFVSFISFFEAKLHFHMFQLIHYKFYIIFVLFLVFVTFVHHFSIFFPFFFLHVRLHISRIQ